jgi:dinuclear metal center YbgI/SA1388 family protein
MVLRDELVSYLDEYLKVPSFADYSNNGLQVEGTGRISKIAFAVDACKPAIDEAIRGGAQMLIVHHGLFWGSVELLRGPLGRKVRAMMLHGLSLYAVHLPLDAHPEVGNNVQLARIIGMEPSGWWGEAKGNLIAVWGEIEPTEREALSRTIGEALGVEPVLMPYGPEKSHRVCISSGLAISWAGEAASIGCDTFITGERSHAHYFAPMDYGMNVIYAGHYATETVGLKALQKHLEDRFDVATTFIEIPTGL